MSKMSNENSEIYCTECKVTCTINDPCPHFELQIVDDTDSETNMKIRDNIEEILISAVQTRPPLWDSRLPLVNRSKTIKEKLWLEISNEVLGGNYSTEFVIKKWRNLRDQFLKTKQDIETYVPSGSEAIKKKKCWKHYEQMKFINDTVNPRMTKCNSSLESGTSIENSPITTNSNKGKAKVHKEDVNERILKAITNMPPPILSVPPISTVPQINPICMRISELLDTLPGHKRIKLEIELLQKVSDVVYND